MKLACVFALTVTALLTSARAEDRPNSAIKEVLDKTSELVRELQRDVRIVEDPEGQVTGRGKKMNRVIIPLVFGFKLASLGMTALAALKILALKSVFMSKLALVTSLLIAFKYMYDKLNKPLHDVTPYASNQHAYWTSPPVWTGSWSEVPSGTELSSSTIELGQSGGLAHSSNLGSSDIGNTASLGDTDLQPHYSLYQANYTNYHNEHARLDPYGYASAERKQTAARPPKYKTTIYKTTVKKYES